MSPFRRVACWILVLAAGTSGGCASSGRGSAPGYWESAPSLIRARAAHAVVADSASIHVLAGTDEQGRPVLEVERFDGERWTVETELPGSGLNAPAAVAMNGRIYLIGGFNTTTNVPTAEMRVFDLASGVWSFGSPLPAPRGGHAAVVLNGKIHVFGGGNDRSTLADHLIYDPASNRWAEAAALPRAEGSPAGTAWEGKIWAIGGRSGFSDFGDVYIYDPAIDRWSEGPPISPRGTAGALTYCGSLLLFGGEVQETSRSLDEVLRFDATSGTWEALEPMPTARNFARAVLLNGSVYVVGGGEAPELGHAAAGSRVVERFSMPCG